MDIATLDNHEDKFLQVLELIPTALVMVNQHGIITMLNVQAERIFCYARQELVGKPMDLLLPERYRAHHFHHIDLFFKNPETRYIGKGRDLFGLRSDGKEIPIEIGLKQIATSDGINVLVVIVDISERKLAGLALTEASDRLKKIANRVPGVVYQFRMRPDGSYSFPFASEAIKAIYHVTPEDVREDASKVFAVFHPDDLDGVSASIKKSATEMELWRHEFRVKYDDGNVRWMLGNAMPELEEDGSILWYGFITDITEQKKVEELLVKMNNELEERVTRRTSDLANMNLTLKKANDELKRTQDELVQHEKMAALGVLVAGVSHEMNTPLGNSLTTSSSLQEEMMRFESEFELGKISKNRLKEFNHYMHSGLDLVIRNLNRAIEQLAHFKQVSVDQVSEQRRRFALKAIVDDNVSILQPQFKHTPHQIVVDIPDAIVMESYPGAIGQVITNLVVNSLIHGFSENMKGTVSISAVLEEGGLVKLIIVDNGKGIPKKNIDHVFDPFFTTRMGQGGSGLGLNIVFNLVKSTLGGHIHLDSEEGSYTNFTILLPLRAPVPD